MMRLNFNRSAGLSFIELLLVVAIIALLVGLAVRASSGGLFRTKRLTSDIGKGQTSITNWLEREDNQQ